MSDNTNVTTRNQTTSVTQTGQRADAEHAQAGACAGGRHRRGRVWDHAVR